MGSSDKPATTSKKSLEYVCNRLAFPAQELLSFPKYFLIENINQCNARCVMCGIDFDNKKRASLSKELFAKIVDEISQHRDHVEKVMVYLDGEPLLDKSLASRVKLLKDNGVKLVNIATNASLLNEKNSVKLIEAGLDEVYITLDSLQKEVYEKIRVGLKFETVLNNILDFIKIRNELNQELTIRIQMVQQKLNWDEGDEFKKFWQSRLNLDSDQIVVQKAHNWGSLVDVAGYNDKDEVNKIPCIALWGTFVVHVDGVVPLCCMDTNSLHSVGNLNNQSIKEIWQGKILATYRQKHLQIQRHEIDICDGCTLWREEKHTG
ncbi:MAG: radical SAM protein [Magnetococcales bacterium]|nr:radical SAM protein [Magnetococcales bacterium]